MSAWAIISPCPLVYEVKNTLFSTRCLMPLHTKACPTSHRACIGIQCRIRCCRRYDDNMLRLRIERAVLFGYVDAAHQRTVERVAALTPTQLGQPIVSHTGERRPAWRALAGMCGDSAQHTGQIAYLRGMLSGYGWRR